MNIRTFPFSRRGVLSAIFAACFFGLLAPEPAEAAYKGGDSSLIKGKRRLRLKEAMAAIRSMPRYAREAFYAEMLGLSFKPDGEQAMEASSQGHSATRRGAHFVSSDGKEHDWLSAFSEADYNLWEKAKALALDVEVPVALSGFSREITKMVHRTAKAILDEMPTELRDCWLAETGGLCYMKGGVSAYSKKKTMLRSEAGYDVPCAKVSSRALFIDTQGKEIAKDKLFDEEVEKKWRRRYNVLHTCAYLVGLQEIQEFYPKEMALLKKNYKQRLKDENTAAGETEAPAMASDTAVALMAWPKGAREAFLAERLWLCYMPDGSSGYDSRMWVQKGGRFIGSDGKECDFWENSNLMSNRDEWVRVSLLYDRESPDDVLEDLRAEVEALRREFNAHAPKSARDRVNNSSAMGTAKPPAK